MIKFQRITTKDATLYNYMEQLMTASFPSEEYRPLEELRNYTDTKTHFYCNIILHHDTPVGCQQLNKPIILEEEMPEEEMAIRRINIYKRHGFTLWEKPYMQPPYKVGDNYLPMLLMAHGNLECEKDFEQVKKCIYREVYKAE